MVKLFHGLDVNKRERKGSEFQILFQGSQHQGLGENHTRLYLLKVPPPPQSTMGWEPSLQYMVLWGTLTLKHNT